MKHVYIIALLLLFLIAPPVTSSGQTSKPGRDKYTLLTMPYNMRPLTLYRGQYRLNGGYKFAVRTKSYNSDGESILLRSKGTGSVYHYYYLDLRYGLLNFIELGVETDFIRRGVRSESTTYATAALSTSNRISVNELKEVKGMGDILLFSTIRTPMLYKWFDLSVTGGMFIPSSKYEPPKPTHSVVTDLTAANSYTVNYHYNFTNGNGVPVYLLSASTKVTRRKLTVAADFTFKTPKQEGKSIRWEETLLDKAFTYYDKSYKYLLSNDFILNTSLHYQATGWFDLSLNGNFHNTKGGWTEYSGRKFKNLETRLISLEPGFELQVSPRLTITQVAGFPLKGMNSDAPFYLFTTIRFSNFLFLR